MAIKNSKMMANSALSFVAGLPCDVYLGGSRRMAEKYGWVQVNADTDYDFYCTYTGEISQMLLDAGFGGSKDHAYDYDDECVQILARDNVQVVLRKDAEFYEKVFENISEEVYINLLWKSSCVAKAGHMKLEMILHVFNTLFAVAHAMEK